MTSQRLGKYACLELERRYLLFEKPVDLAQDACIVITDRYSTGTRLRLRHMASPNGKLIAQKLTQKFQLPSQDPTEATITNLYLDEAEYHCLATLAARMMVKHRYQYEGRGQRYSIDIFKEQLDGLVLAEIEAETVEELAALLPPPFKCQEVTDDAFFRGGTLAGISKANFRQGMANRLANYSLSLPNTIN